MTIIAPLLFSSIFMLALSAIMLGVGGALPRIGEIFRAVHADQPDLPKRKITVHVPVTPSAEIVAFPGRNDAEEPAMKLAA